MGGRAAGGLPWVVSCCTGGKASLVGCIAVVILESLAVNMSITQYLSGCWSGDGESRFEKSNGARRSEANDEQLWCGG